MFIQKSQKLTFDVLMLFFVFYSFMGWLMEIAVVFLEYGYFENRGFIFGPFCIIYGFGMLSLIIFLRPFENNILAYFILSSLMITIIEYSTGFIMEVVFQNRWWDYSHIPYNLNGYICLRISLIWGLLAVFIVKFFHPLIYAAISKLPKSITKKLSSGAFIFFILNITLSIIFHLI